MRWSQSGLDFDFRCCHRSPSCSPSCLACLLPSSWSCWRAGSHLQPPRPQPLLAAVGLGRGMSNCPCGFHTNSGCQTCSCFCNRPTNHCRWRYTYIIITMQCRHCHEFCSHNQPVPKGVNRSITTIGVIEDRTGSRRVKRKGGRDIRVIQ